MFTGIIEEIGTIRAVAPAGASVRVEISCQTVLQEARRGESIAVDGCCLTVEELLPGGFTVFASPETLAKTALGDRRPGDGVNLERALSLGARLGGHLVSGHVDTTGHFLSARAIGEAWEIRVAAPPEILHRTIPKGSICLDGISLTVVDLTEKEFSCWIIPETWNRTTLHDRRPGDRMNLESDLVGKYLWRFLEVRGAETSASDERLRTLLEKGGWSERG